VKWCDKPVFKKIAAQNTGDSDFFRCRQLRERVQASNLRVKTKNRDFSRKSEVQMSNIEPNQKITEKFFSSREIKLRRKFLENPWFFAKNNDFFNKCP